MTDVFKLNTDLLSHGDRLVVAVSGGIDSMVLLHCLNSLKDSFGISLYVCHVNHHTREACKAEAELVEETCRQYGLPLEILDYHYSEEDNFHQASRKARYDFFRKIALKKGANKIVLAHQADDLAETILMRIVRGSSLSGYAGILNEGEYQGVKIIRPLLGVSRNDIAIYQQENSVSFMEDESNLKDDYTRNRFRHHVMPPIKEENPAYTKKFAQFSQYLSEAYSLVRETAEAFISRHIKFEDTFASVPANKIARENPAVRKEICKLVIDRLSQDSVEVSFTQFLDLDTLACGDKTYAEIDIGNDLTVIKSYDDLYFHRYRPETIRFEFRIDGFGEYRLPDGSLLSISTNNSIFDGKPHELWYNDLDSVFPITIRNRRDGDRVEMAVGSKKIKDLFIQKKIPHADRDTLPVILDKQGKIIWIPRCFHQKQGEGKLCMYLSYRKGK